MLSSPAKSSALLPSISPGCEGATMPVWTHGGTSLPTFHCRCPVWPWTIRAGMSALLLMKEERPQIGRISQYKVINMSWISSLQHNKGYFFSILCVFMSTKVCRCPWLILLGLNLIFNIVLFAFICAWLSVSAVIESKVEWYSFQTQPPFQIHNSSISTSILLL